MIFYDTETCGLHGLPVLIQYAYDDGPVILHNTFKEPIWKTLDLIDDFMCHEFGVVGFNLAFDQFHLCKIYTTLRLHPDHNDYPEDIPVALLASYEKEGRDGPCLKPVRSCDLMLHARKGEYQSTMDRKDIKVKKIPTILSHQVAQYLNDKLQFKDIYFSRFADKHRKRWNVHDLTTPDGEINPTFKDIVCSFQPSAALKVLAQDALGEKDDDILLFQDIEVPRRLRPNELGYAPYALALGNSRNWNQTWPVYIHYHYRHWQYHKLARQYAKKDVEYTRNLYKYFGSPDLGDDDSELACAVAAVRWKGFKIDYQGVKALKNEAQARADKAPKDPGRVKHWLWDDLSEEEKTVTGGSTKKTILETISKFKDHCSCVNVEYVQESWDSPIEEKTSDPDSNCDKCNGEGSKPTKAAVKAKAVLDARTAQKEVELYDKLLIAGRFHASFKVIGALSGRMSGADKLNAQGIKSTKEVRGCFPLAFEGEHLCGGDFESFEVVLAEALYQDPKLREFLTTPVDCPICDATGVIDGESCEECHGSAKTIPKIHSAFAMELFPGNDFQAIMKSKGTENDMYTKGKSAVFSQIYGGDHNTIHDRLGIDIDVAERAAKSFAAKFPGVAKAQQEIFNDFCSMRQPGGIGSRVEWHDPAPYVESLFGFRRYFTLENYICKTLFQIAENPPKQWNIAGKVVRRDRDQTMSGAVRSALFASAFNIQASNMRAAMNHQIQSSGAQITKRVQRKIWDLQPSGIHPWRVRPMNIHDEIMVVTKKQFVPKIRQVVEAEVELYRPRVPLIAIDWSDKLESWAEK